MPALRRGLNSGSSSGMPWVLGVRSREPRATTVIWPAATAPTRTRTGAPALPLLLT